MINQLKIKHKKILSIYVRKFIQIMIINLYNLYIIITTYSIVSDNKYYI